MALKKIRRVAAIALALGTATALAACSGPTVSDSGGGDSSAPLIFDIGFEMTTLDPAVIFDVSASTVNGEIYEGLVDWDASTGEIVGALAEDWEVNEDATEYRFTLLDGVTFESGGTLTSADAVFAFERLRNLQGPPSYLTDGLSFSADGDDTVVITSEASKPELLSMLTSSNFAIYDSEAVQEEGAVSDESAATADTAGDVFSQKSFGTGPYSLVKYEPNAEAELKASENYRGDAPDFPNVLIRNSRSIQQQILNIQNGGSDVTVSLSSPQVAELDESKVKVLSQPLPQVIYFALTNSGGPTTNADYRKAIALGIDYEGLVEVAGAGGQQATSVIPSVLEGSVPQGEGLTQDVDAAKAALEASGMADQELSISFGSDYTVGGQDMSLFAQKIQSDLEAIGMKVKLDGAPTQVSRTANQEGKVQAALWPFPPDYADASQFLIHGPGGLLGERIHWAAEDEPEITALAEKAQNAIDPEERAAAYQEWALAIRDTNRFIAIVEVPQNLVTSTRVGNLNMDVTGHVKIHELTLEQ